MVIRTADKLRKEILCLLVVMTPFAGCGTDIFSEDPETAAEVDTSIDNFVSAKPIDLNPNSITVLSGEIIEPSHIEVWDLGPIEAGTRLIVDLKGEGNNLSVGLFNQDRQVKMINHNRYGGKDPYCILEINSEIETLYLAVSSDPIEASSGAYSVTLTHSDGHSFEAAQVQKVVLNFSGARNVSIGNLPAIDIADFDAADLDPSWEDYTEEMKSIVFESLERIYAGLNVELYYDDDPNLPSDENLTWIHFGADDSSNVGLADSVDYGNRYKKQKAVVYTQNFAKYIKHGYTYQEIAQGFANVGSHELGHLLGLNHTDDPVGVMNVSPTPDALVAPQYFVDSPGLDPKVFKTGFQDGAEIIFTTVGGDWRVVENSRQNSAAYYAKVMPDEKSRRHSDETVHIAQLSSAQHCKPHDDH